MFIQDPVTNLKHINCMSLESALTHNLVGVVHTMPDRVHVLGIPYLASPCETELISFHK